ncbi:hypothetical protein BGP_3098 [Beggiatoa sp. PS]|nr:hypothetical protein BGP_3098 [Beggiatoa sp. PS]
MKIQENPKLKPDRFGIEILVFEQIYYRYQQDTSLTNKNIFKLLVSFNGR